MLTLTKVTVFWRRAQSVFSRWMSQMAKPKDATPPFIESIQVEVNETGDGPAEVAADHGRVARSTHFPYWR